jgi:hypothetical protein
VRERFLPRGVISMVKRENCTVHGAHLAVITSSIVEEKIFIRLSVDPMVLPYKRTVYSESIDFPLLVLFGVSAE